MAWSDAARAAAREARRKNVKRQQAADKTYTAKVNEWAKATRIKDHAKRKAAVRKAVSKIPGW